MDIKTTVAERLFALVALALLPALSSGAQDRETLRIPDHSWKLWLDSAAAWQQDTLYLPEDVDLRKIPVSPPTGGWRMLDRVDAETVALPGTVEEHFWVVRGFPRDDVVKCSVVFQS